MARAVSEGAVSAGAEVNLKKATEATMDDLLNADGIILGTPNNFNYMAGTLKEFLDQVYIHLRDHEASKSLAVFASGGATARPVMDIIERICQAFSQRHKFKFEKVAEAVEAIGKPSPEALEQCKEMGKKVAQA